jgi:RNA polymerase sigma factor for flagellar operon FliA
LNPQKRDVLILEYYPMVRRVAYRMVRRLPSCVEADDLIHVGVLGLIDAVDRYEPGLASSFGGYVRMRVQGAMLDEMRKNDWVPRSVRNRAALLQRETAALAEELGRAPTPSELAKRLHMTEAQVEEMARNSRIRSLVSMEEETDAGTTVGEMLASDDLGPVENVLRAARIQAVRAAVAQLPERDRAIAELYYFRDVNMKDIAEILGVTESRVSQLHTRIKDRIRARLQEAA